MAIAMRKADQAVVKSVISASDRIFWLIESPPEHGSLERPYLANRRRRFDIKIPILQSFPSAFTELHMWPGLIIALGKTAAFLACNQKYVRVL